jgi:hypothetical protein
MFSRERWLLEVEKEGYRKSLDFISLLSSLGSTRTEESDIKSNIAVSILYRIESSGQLVVSAETDIRAFVQT